VCSDPIERNGFSIEQAECPFPVSEPSALLLLGMGIGAAVIAARKRRPATPARGRLFASIELQHQRPFQLVHT
jgi:hypothetical protein